MASSPPVERGGTPMPTSSASVIGRSKWLPSLARSAGARLIVMRLGGRPSPSAPSALRTRSRDSATALSGGPTRVNVGRFDRRSHQIWERAEELARKLG